MRFDKIKRLNKKYQRFILVLDKVIIAKPYKLNGDLRIYNTINHIRKTTLFDFCQTFSHNVK